MDCKATVDIVLTAAIVTFAGLTWWSTRTYSYIAGVSLFIQANKEISGITQNPDRAMAMKTVRAIRRQFPRVYEDMQECLNTDTRKEIEEMK